MAIQKFFHPGAFSIVLASIPMQSEQSTRTGPTSMDWPGVCKERGMWQWPITRVSTLPHMVNT